MKISSNGIINGVIQDKYGIRGKVNKFEMPIISPHLKITDYPTDTVSFAIFLEDKDAFPNCGFSWIHWVLANLCVDELEENASQTRKGLIQGANSWFSELNPEDRHTCYYYGGMAPPDCDHLYEFHVYALDCTLNLRNGFHMNDMFKQMDGHILDYGVLKGWYKF